MDENSRQECGKILQNKFGQYFFVCQTCFCEFLSLEAFIQHRRITHGAKKQHQAKEHGGRKLLNPQQTSGQQSTGKFVKEKNRSIGITKFHKAAPSHTSVTQSTSINPSAGTSHTSSSIENGGTIMTGIYKCENCLDKFTTLLDFAIHEEKCRKNRFNCDYCSKTFVTASGLRLHIHNHHKSSLPFSCTVCPKGFNKRYELTLHRRKHENNMQVGCPFCEKIFLSAYEKENHVKRRHPFATYQCKDCLYETKYEAVLRRHHSKMHG